MKTPDKTSGYAARRAVTQADEMVRAVESTLRLSVHLIDTLFGEEYRGRPGLDDLARQLELAHKILDQARELLADHGLDDGEMVEFGGKGRPLWDAPRPGNT